jgi:hypothetical protein
LSSYGCGFRSQINATINTLRGVRSGSGRRGRIGVAACHRIRN